ncbi:dermonecrotic toxin domain-containing protein [Pseudomonas sp. SLFW]|uniref:dermonecrotic toxin domain-containing protein n=1 Tax=Pseudomonas sp. SLFW TaxID=2683259 RepID=UPI001412993A|nr:DUF6543 domain-containing protein [Pseudomonas sp. SLFW]NBB12785.1 hypothetical protein [Pseudomonas sp. SLFW]
MTGTVLQPVDLLTADEPHDQPLQSLSIAMPLWLSTVEQSVRDEYAQRLTEYHASAQALESHLDHALPSFEGFVRARIKARIKDDLGIDLDLDPDRVTVELPKRVWRDYRIDPQYGRVTNYFAPWVASREREHLTLAALAERNFAADDAQMARRFDFAAIHGTSRLTGTWLHAVIPKLDVALHYRNLLKEVFRLAPGSTAQQQLDAERLLEPYQHKIELEAFSEIKRRRLSEAGGLLLQLAAQSRSQAESDAAGIEMNWLQFKPGTSVSGEQDSHTLSGLCVIRSSSSNNTVIYLPDAPGDLLTIEGADPASAKSRLMQRLISTPALVTYLAQRTLEAQQVARHVSYINQAQARGFEGFLRFVPALDLQLAAQQLDTRAWMLQQAIQSRARTRFDIQTEQNRQQGETYVGYLKALLGLLPGIGTLVSVQDGWLDGHDAMKAFREGRLDDGLLALGSTAMSVLDVAMSVIPGAASVFVLGRMARRGARLGTATSGLRPHLLMPFEGYEVPKTLTDAVPQSGRDLGTLLKDGQLWIEREGQAYEVYRRAGEQTLRLKKTAVHGFEPPVRFHNGAWVYHSDVGLRGGMRSTIAETLIAQAHGDPAFKNRHARQLLDEFEFPADRQRRLELDIAVHYQQHKATPEWAEAYRRPPQAEPQPGTSGSKRKEPPQPSALRDALDGADRWKRWGRPLDDAGRLQQIEVFPPIFRLKDQPGSTFVQIDGQRFDILPSGASQNPSIVFLKHPTPLEDSFSGLNETIRRDRFNQPGMASFKDGHWTVHGPLFRLKIQHLVEEARPGLSPVTCRILAEKIYDAADQAHTGLTATRLINIKATLNAWKRGQLAPFPQLNDPLLMLEGAHFTGIGTTMPRMWISYGPSIQEFKRLDFAVSKPPLVTLLERVTGGPRIGTPAKTAMREFMSALITDAGYRMVSDGEAVLQVRSILLFRRTGQEHLYMLHTHHVSASQVEFQTLTPNAAVPLSNRWIDEWAAARPGEGALNTLLEVRDQGRLVKLIGGVRSGSSLEPAPQVFIQRVAEP